MQIHNDCDTVVNFGQVTGGLGWSSALVAYDLNLGHVATNALGGQYSLANDIAVDGSGNIYVMGQFSTFVDVPTNIFSVGDIKTVTQINPETVGVWISVYSADGALVQTNVDLSTSESPTPQPQC